MTLSNESPKNIKDYCGENDTTCMQIKLEEKKKNTNFCNASTSSVKSVVEYCPLSYEKSNINTHTKGE